MQKRLNRKGILATAIAAAIGVATVMTIRLVKARSADLYL